MQMSELVRWAKTIRSESREKRMKYVPNSLPKIDAYVQMIIDRGEIIQTETIRMNRFMEEIQEGLARLQKLGVDIPTASKDKPTSENPLRP